LLDASSSDIGNSYLIHKSESTLIAQVKMSIAIYFRTWLRKIVSNLTPLPQIQKIIELIYRACISPNLEYSVKVHLGLVFE
jgi:hypothetical protein